MTARTTLFTTIRTEGLLLPPDLLQRIAEGDTSLEGLTAESYHRPGEKLNEVINQSWNTLQGIWANFKTQRERLPESDAGTTLTRERWLLPLFRELDYGRLPTASAADFTIEGKHYPISHRSAEGHPIHLVSYQVDLDKRPLSSSSASPHSLVQVLLNRDEALMWGFVSNGDKLRILRDNASLTRQAYVEFDLQAMMEGEVYSDFVLVWRLCHHSRFLMRCELDVLYFHLYGISRDDVDYIMDTFPIVRRKDEAKYDGVYRTKETILAMYDAMAAAGWVEGYQTWLTPGPADASVAHQDTRS